MTMLHSPSIQSPVWDWGLIKCHKWWPQWCMCSRCCRCPKPWMITQIHGWSHGCKTCLTSRWATNTPKLVQTQFRLSKKKHWCEICKKKKPGLVVWNLCLYLTHVSTSLSYPSVWPPLPLDVTVEAGCNRHLQMIKICSGRTFLSHTLWQNQPDARKFNFEIFQWKYSPLAQNRTAWKQNHHFCFEMTEIWQFEVRQHMGPVYDSWTLTQIVSQLPQPASGRFSRGAWGRSNALAFNRCLHILHSYHQAVRHSMDGVAYLMDLHTCHPAAVFQKDKNTRSCR